ncbi:MAG: hypothetical protein HFF40_11005 [Lawsonibacter sp.]|nr:hypothetical protein [Lawsonibacter sp.]
MSKELFGSMNKQMTPSPQVRAALSEKLAQPVKKRPVPWKKYTALAACAALVIGAFSLHSYGQEDGQWMFFLRSFHRDVIETKLHSYVTVDDLTGFVSENATTATGGSEGSDQDMGMTPEDLTAAMLDVGYTQDEVDEYQSIGYQMTWANWWKFVHQQENSEGDDPFNLDDLKLFSQKELYVRTGALPAPNTGDLPGGAYIGDIPVQVGAEDYQKLMEHFNGTYPDWYGGAYLDESGRLVVQLVEDKDPGDKSLELQVLDWTGSDQVMFSSCKYSLAQLKELMDQLNALPGQDMKFRDVMAGWGINEEANRIELTLTQVYDPILVVLAELDPDDDAIYVQVGQRATADVGTEDPAVRHVMPGGVPVPDDEDLAAVEPCYVEELPGKLPKEEQRPATNVEAPAYDPDAK